MRNKIFALFTLSIILTACASAPTHTITPSPAPTISTAQTLTPVPFTTPRWVLYERALSYIFLGPPERTMPDMSADNGLCEWEIWGQKENEIYVYALCQADNEFGTAASSPAVIRLGKAGTILEVEIPDNGYGNLEELFPEDILARISKSEFAGNAAWDRIQKRRKDPSIVPLIVEQGFPLP